VAAQPAGTLEQVREDALEQAARLVETKHVIGEYGFSSPSCDADELAKAIRALAAAPQVQAGEKL